MIRALACASLVVALASCARDPIEGSACGDVERPTMAPKTLDRDFRGFSAGIASDGTSVYYSGANEGSLLRMPLSGGAKPDVLLRTPRLRRIIGHGTRVCWADPERIACLVGDGPAFEVARPTPAPLYYDYAFDFDETWVYWLERGALMRAPLDRSAAATVLLATHEEWSMITVGAGHIVFATTADTTVYACETADACATLRVLEAYGTNRATLGRIAVDAHFAYVPVVPVRPGERRAGKVRRIALDGDRVDDLAFCTDEVPVAVAVDDATAFVLTRTSGGQPDADCTGSVLAVPLAGGVPRRLARDQRCPWSIALAPGKVVWSNAKDHGDGELLVLPR